MASTRPQKNAWLLLAVGDNRQYGGNSGYDDLVDVYYSWDSTVPNSGNIQVGDLIAIWDKVRLLGISVVEEIRTSNSEKIRLRCPNVNCNSPSIKTRKIRLPLYKCQQCRFEFDEPVSELIQVTNFVSRHDAAWTWLENVLDGPQLRSLCLSKHSQHSMRALNYSTFTRALQQAGQGQSLARLSGRTADFVFATNGLNLDIPLGFNSAVVRVRRGQRKFRERLFDRMGSICAFTGEAPDRVLEAGHLYSYAKLGEHHRHGGLLLRRDIHRLFDDGSLAVNPSTRRIHVRGDLANFDQYAALNSERLQVPVSAGELDWLAKHWEEHRLRVR